MSRAACSANVASAAWSEPTCLCASPLRLRMNTSHNGVFGVCIVGLHQSRRESGRRPAAPAFVGIGLRRLAHPCAFIVGLAPRRQPLAIAGTVAGKYLLEFVPVDLAVLPMSGGLVPLHARIGNGQLELLGLRHRGVDELLLWLIVR